MRLIDVPSPMTTPEHYSGLMLLAVNSYLETESEPWEGKLAVAFNPCNRAAVLGWSLHKVILGPDELAYDDGHPYETYSCWNDDYRKQAYSRISNIPNNPKGWEEACKAAAAAYWKLLPDPSNGAYFYLNVELTKAIRSDHGLPGWWFIDTDPASETKWGQHTFRRKK